MVKETTTNKKYTYALGRRKTSTATVRLFEEKGEVLVNDKPLNKYVNQEIFQKNMLRPLEVAGFKKGEVYFTSQVNGGGINSQVDAIKLALSRAIAKLYPEKKSDLRKEGLLTRDPRMVERKKTGLRKARKKEQYSKR